MNEKERIQKVKEGLENDIYKKIEELETTKHLSKESTEKLADNLRSYLEGKDLEEEISLNKELKEVGQHKVQVGSVDEQTLVQEYNNHIYNTIDDELFEEEDSELEEFIDKTLTEIDLMEENNDEISEFAKELGFGVEAVVGETTASTINEEDEFAKELGYTQNSVIEEIEETIEIDESDVDIETNVLEEEAEEVEQVKSKEESDVEKRKKELDEKRNQKQIDIEEKEEIENKRSVIDILLIIAMIIIILLIVYIFFL